MSPMTGVFMTNSDNNCATLLKNTMAAIIPIDGEVGI